MLPVCPPLPRVPMRHAYSVLLSLLLPLLVLRLLWRSRLAPAYRRRLGERLGRIDLAIDGRPLVWVHAVSLGETLAARPLIDGLLASHPDHQVLVTTTTPTGSAQVLRLFGDRVLHVYAPWDTPAAVQRFLRRTQPRLLVLMETELWPNLLHYCAAAGCAVVLANARLSARSARGYARVATTTRRMLAAIDLIAAQHAADAGRFVALGAPTERVRVTGSIKFDVCLDASLRDAAARLVERWCLAQRPVLIVASTHEGEDEIALDAFATLRARAPGALLLLAPRHPERFDAVHRRCRDAGLVVRRRSLGDDVDATVEVLLVDTLGELLMLFGIADVAVIGGSFVPNGGHNPLEAAVWGLPVLCGPSMFNFADITAQLSSAGALEQVDDAASLGRRVGGLLDDPAELARRGAAAPGVVDANRGAVAALAAAIDGLLVETAASGQRE